MTLKAPFLTVIIITISLLSLSCAQKPKVACNEVDWFEIGRIDGASGRTEEYLKQHNQICSKKQFEKVSHLYYHGRSAGLTEYCDPINAFELGRSGNRYDYVCPLEFQDSFLEDYNRGRQILKIEESKLAINKMIQNLKQQIKTHGKSDSAPAGLLSELQSLEKAQVINDARISKLIDDQSASDTRTE